MQRHSNRSPRPALGSASAGRRKELASRCYQKEAEEFDLMPLILKKICTGRLSRLTGLSKLNLSAKLLGFELCYRTVKFPTKPLAFCRGELTNSTWDYLVFYFWGYFFWPQLIRHKAQEDGICFVMLHGKPWHCFLSVVVNHASLLWHGVMRA